MRPHLPLPTRLVATARLAASSGRDRAAGELVAAFEDGSWAARHGHRIPLFVILDVRSVLNDLAVGRSLTVPQRPDGSIRCQACTDYDEWLSNFVRTLLRHLGRTNLATIASTANEGTWAVGPHLPPLLAAWPDHSDSETDEPRDWFDSYRFLAADPRAYIDAVAYWTGPRTAKAEHWLPWPKPIGQLPPEPLLWSRFAADQPGEKLHQRFDHAAAELYLRASDPPPQAELDARLQDERETLAFVDKPYAESAEEQHPFVGSPTVYTYTLGDYGLFKLTNRSDPRLSTPPRANRPQPFEAHLAWAVGYRGLRTPVGQSRVRSYSQNLIGEDVSQASVLQGVVGLLLDDWRSALARHRLSFHLHRFGASPDEWTPKPGSPVRAILPGKRWKSELLSPTIEQRTTRSKDSEASSLPPFGVTGLLFRRPSLADAGPVEWKFGGRSGEPVPDARKWWCGVMLRDELERDLGFRNEDVIGSSDLPFAPPVWSGPVRSLPRVLRHLIVVDPALRTGWLCTVDFAAGRILLRPRHSSSEPPDDECFTDLRQATILAVAEVLFDLAPV